MTSLGKGQSNEALTDAPSHTGAHTGALRSWPKVKECQVPGKRCTWILLLDRGGRLSNTLR